MNLTEKAKKTLERKGIAIPDSDEEVRRLAFEALKDEDFIAAHSFRLNKERPSFTKEDWASILEISGKEKVVGNMAGLMACLSHGLLTPDDVRS